MTDHSPHTTVITVTYQSRDLIADTLAPLVAGTQAGSLRVIVVDNASADQTAEHVRGAFPQVQVIDHGGNHGFARGCNRGFAEVDTPYTLFLNPDASLSTAQIEEMARFLDAHPEVGACAPAIENPTGGLQKSGMMISPATLIKQACLGHPLPMEREIEPGEEPRGTNWICGAIYMVRSDLYRQVGMMDPRFFMYFEETDLCRKILAQGQEIWTLGKIKASHQAGSSARKVAELTGHRDLPQYFFPSRYYYLTKNHGWLAGTATELILFAHLLLRSAWRRLRGRSDGALTHRLRGGLLRLPKRPR